MLKVGVIGLGDIAQKAYLPVIATKDVEIHLFTRDEKKRAVLGRQYRISHIHESIDSLVQAGVDAAFVHTSTGSHYQIVEQLLLSNIHVYVDKPVTYDYRTTEKLVMLAGEKGLALMAGFNRRYAPAYVSLKGVENPNMLVMQKNRRAHPADVRAFIFDDFIHVIDTLLFLFPDPIENLSVTGRITEDGLLHHVVAQFYASNGRVAVGIMNRDSGTVEERLEVYSAEEKRTVLNVSETFVAKDRDETRQRRSEWESTLHKRGFEQIIKSFLETVSNHSSPDQLHKDILQTHHVCERIVEALCAPKHL
jgi:virulence factor